MRDKIRLQILFNGVILSLLLLTGCRIESEILETISPLGERFAIKLNVLPNINIETSTITTSVDELIIRHGYLFVFNPDGDYETHKELIVDSLNIKNNGTTTPIIYVYDLEKFSETNTTVLVLNHKMDEPKGFFSNIKLSNIDSCFTLGGKGTTGLETTVAMGIPMYGEITNLSKTNDSITIQRCVATLQVQLSADITSDDGIDLSDFTTGNVTYGLYNLAVSGNFRTLTGINSSTANNAPATTASDDGIMTITSSVGATGIGVNYIYEYPYATQMADDGKNNPIDIDKMHINRLAIILKVSKASTNPRYYRLDMVNKNSTSPVNEYLNIERNRHYTVVIDKINDNGYNSAEEAINGSPNNVSKRILHF